MKKLKVGVWIMSDYSPEAGGGFSLYDRLIRAIDTYDFDDELEICFIGIKKFPENKFKKNYICIHKTGYPDLLLKMANRFNLLLNYINDSRIEILNKNKIDLVYYPTQTFRAIQNFPFIATNWDVGHKSTFAFPEVTMNGAFEHRDKWYSKELQKALMVFAESESGKKELITYTQINPDRIAVVPLFAGGVIDITVDQQQQLSLLSSLAVSKKEYFFYPAQFWAHKNQSSLIKAFEQFASAQPNIKLVLTGSDYGNKNYIKELAVNSDFRNRIVITGFISNEMLYTLYKNAIALVMPTLMGPTNMPLLEAQALDCPVICSDFPGHRELMQNSALYIDPLNIENIADAMKKISDSEIEKELMKAAEDVKAKSIFNLHHALKNIEANFKKIKLIRQVWGQQH